MEMDMDEEDVQEEVKRSTQPPTTTLGAGLGDVTVREYNPHGELVE